MRSARFRTGWAAATDRPVIKQVDAGYPCPDGAVVRPRGAQPTGRDGTAGTAAGGSWTVPSDQVTTPFDPFDPQSGSGSGGGAHPAPEHRAAQDQAPDNREDPNTAALIAQWIIDELYRHRSSSILIASSAALVLFVFVGFRIGGDDPVSVGADRDGGTDIEAPYAGTTSTPAARTTTTEWQHPAQQPFGLPGRPARSSTGGPTTSLRSIDGEGSTTQTTADTTTTDPSAPTTEPDPNASTTATTTPPPTDTTTPSSTESTEPPPTSQGRATTNTVEDGVG